MIDEIKKLEELRTFDFINNEIEEAKTEERTLDYYSDFLDAVKSVILDGIDENNYFLGRDLIPNEFLKILDSEDLSVIIRYTFSLLILRILTNSDEVFNDTVSYGYNRDLEFLESRRKPYDLEILDSLKLLRNKAILDDIPDYNSDVNNFSDIIDVFAESFSFLSEEERKEVFFNLLESLNGKEKRKVVFNLLENYFDTLLTLAISTDLD